MVKLDVQKNYGLFINGEWTNGTGNELIDVISPATGEKIAAFVDATNEDVDAAVEAAEEALKTWRHTSIEERSRLMLKIADIIDDNLEHLALVETLDNGKPIRETLNIDLPAASDHFRYFAGVIRSEEGTAQAFDENRLSIVIKEPIGVVGQVIPWNFPFLMAAWKLAPALATGNTVVISPSSTTSLSILEFARLIDGVLPKGVLNVVTGRGRKSGDYLLNHPGIDKLAFTGSTEVGYTVAEAAAKRLVPATLELGGKSANIFFDDMPYEKALDGAQMGILFNQGQVCSAGSRIFVQEGIYDRFVADLKEAFEKINVGLPWEEETQMGCQVSEGHLNKILDYVRIGKEEGATVLTGGNRITDGELGKGVFMQPTLLSDVTNDMRVAQEEIFGPVAVIIKFKDIDEVIAMANDSEYGLAGGVWTQDLNKALKVGREVQTGRVWVNTYNQLPAGTPFGGVKNSGIGRETYKSMVDAYTQMKNIYIDTNEKSTGLYS
ncbi:aldehyde dehydrogenase family protein [Vagococcus lutrae]|uniref:Aldehyde dehydrogenase family protein n=1 Tax=Vagococcus lutrae TaxID=81947 RepID=A0AAE9XFH9_9ENTE|nr:aldehyde dehydrogenase family protein [Vagococcus lutrae]MDT2806361.1 aldehyde dehydrogenase family protein [Vagococcus lutrae]MDT2813061.1 aldehyde dehydrogenase family protein [Vagococcus lutrae]MDT2816631.1 aldehyde dehydrogenase family protein [Vagococcus lutrae]MDY3706335.1 aldehyde dehydrogenase family protein [Vagococcus lutrae]RST90661.1 aldehyde dehydrogenase [Vagococcus lutrae]